MKYVLGIFFLCCGYFVQAQNQNIDAIRGNFREALGLPVIDTVIAPYKLGEIRVRPQDSLMYRFNGRASGFHRWQRINIVDSISVLNDSTLHIVMNGVPTNYVLRGGTKPGSGGSTDSTLFVTITQLNARSTTLQNSINTKQTAGPYITALQGSVIASGPGLTTATLNNTGVVAGYYYNANVTVSPDGRISAISNGSIGGGDITQQDLIDSAADIRAAIGVALSDSVIAGGPITSVPVIGDNPGTNINAAKFIATEFYKSMVPTASLTGGQVFETMAAGADIAGSVNWGAGRQSATANLSTIVITGPSAQSYSESFSNPAPGGNVSGSRSVTIIRNTSNTFTNTVTTSDAKVATATTNFSFQYKRYWGFVASPTPTVGTVLGLSQELTTTRAKGLFTISTPSGPQYMAFCYPTSMGALTSLTIGGFESLPAFTQSTVSFTNASGAVTNYYYYVSTNTFSIAVNNIITQ